MQRCLTGAPGGLFRRRAAELLSVLGSCFVLLTVAALLLHLQLFIPAWCFHLSRKTQGWCSWKQENESGAGNLPSSLLPALLPPALPALPQPGMPGDAGAGAGKWGDTSMTQPHPELKAVGDTWGQQVHGDRRVLVPPEWQQEFRPQFLRGNGHGGLGP